MNACSTAAKPSLTLSADMPFSSGGRLGAPPALSATAVEAGTRGGGVGIDDTLMPVLLVALVDIPAGLNKLGGDAEHWSISRCGDGSSRRSGVAPM